MANTDLWKMEMQKVLFISFCALCWASDGLVPEHNMVKRSDDTDPLTAVVTTLTQELGTLRAQLQAVQTELQTMKNNMNKKAAFHGILSTSTPTPNAPVRMNVVYQTGNGYDVISGIFSAPYSGWYSVDFQLFPMELVQGYFNVDLLLNGITLARARCIDTSIDTTCNSGVTLHVNAGDKLWIQMDLASVKFFATLFDSFFSIALVFPDN